MKILIALLFLTGCNMHYSDGVRTGQLYKFSKKGFINKTWEGTLKTGFITKSDSGMIAEEFYFSVTDEAVAVKLNTALTTGKPVELSYDQIAFTSWFVSPDSDYRIKDVKILQ